jgi:hypothetical protein
MQSAKEATERARKTRSVFMAASIARAAAGA